MKVVILAGGFGSRLSEETELKPKPMIQIGGWPILWHIMKIYSLYRYNDFIILLGYKGYMIKEYFANYFLHQSDVTIDLSDNSMKTHNNYTETWKVTLLDTGLNTMTGGRIKRAQKYLEKETFLLTYGDGVSDVNISNLLEFHNKHKRAMTMMASQPEGRFGAININNNGMVNNFQEKPKGDGAWVNAGFFVCEPKIFNYLTEGDQTIFERTPMENLARDNQLIAYKYKGFWKPMDTLRDKNKLEELIEKNTAPWIKW